MIPNKKITTLLQYIYYIINILLDSLNWTSFMIIDFVKQNYYISGILVFYFILFF